MATTDDNPRNGSNSHSDGRARRSGVAILAAMVFAGTFMPAAIAADPANGERLARRWCASCHVVAPGQAQASADVPPFASIAKRPDFDAGRLALFLLNPHPIMPNMNLSRIEAADLAAYIESLK